MSRSADLVVHGRTVDDQTRCVHYHSPLDIVAIRFACCGKYYPCYECHNEAEDHVPQVWPRRRFGEPAILCGVCRAELSIERYREADRCPECGSPFNPGCALHAHLYFDVSPAWRTGDLVFLNRGETEFAESVAAVVQGWDGCVINHVALVTPAGVVEAVHEGVRETSREEFLSHARPMDDQGTVFLLGRLRSEHQGFAAPAVEWARNQGGKPYNETFEPGLDSFYCSQLVVEAFRAVQGAGLFAETAMNFTDPRTGTVLPYWEEWYARRGRPVPQGAPGSHPAGLSLSDKLTVWRGE